MTRELEIEIAGPRARRPSRGLTGWLRTMRPFDRRAIREPASRDAYWVNVRRRLAVSDAASLIGARETERPSRQTPADTIG